MGNLNAMGMAEAVNDGGLGLRQALSWHLSADHYPPLPHAYVEVAEAAIDLANEGQWDDHVELGQQVISTGMIPRTAFGDPDDVLYLRVSDAVEIMHLASFITWEDED